MQSNRILSIDIFRGLTIFMMVFVNELAGVTDIPAWMKHVPLNVDGMTIVDVVFPAFLFIVGMSIPFAIDYRDQKSKSAFEFWQHILIRTFGLLVLGVFMVNAGEMNVEATLIPKRCWSSLLYIAAILIWNNYPKPGQKDRKNLFHALQGLGILILIGLFLVYRKGSLDNLTGMTPSWWGILGLIGWAYLISVIVYKIASKTWWKLVMIFIGLFGFLLLLRSGTKLPFILEWFSSQSGHICHTIIVLSGVLCSLILTYETVKTSQAINMLKATLVGLILGTLGYFTQSFGGVSKILATPSWALYSVALCFFVYILMYWLVDIKKIKEWANFLTPAGKNPLLTYILPSLFYAIFGYAFIPDIMKFGLGGMARSVIFSLLILWVAHLMTKKGIRLQL